MQVLCKNETVSKGGALPCNCFLVRDRCLFVALTAKDIDI